MDHTSEFSPQGELYVSEPSHDRLLTSHSPLTTGCAATLFLGGLGLCLKDPPPPTPTPFMTRSLVFHSVRGFSTKRPRGYFFFVRKMCRYRKKGDQSTIRTLRAFLLAKLMRRTDEAGSGWHTMRRIQVLYVLPEEKKQSKCSHKGNTAVFLYPGASEPHPSHPPAIYFLPKQIPSYCWI